MKMNTNKMVINNIFGSIVLILCVFIAGFWEVMSNRAGRAFSVYGLKAADFEDFRFDSDGPPVLDKEGRASWIVRRIPVTSSPEEPNILALELRDSPESPRGRDQRTVPTFQEVGIRGRNIGPACLRLQYA